MLRRVAAICLLLVCLISSVVVPAARVRAQSAHDCIDRMTDAEVTYRLRHLVARFEEEKTRARWWWYGWMGIAVGGAAFSWTRFALADPDDRAERDAHFISGTGSILLAALLSAIPMTPAFAPQRLARRPEATPAQRRAKLRYATELLERSARAQRPGSSFVGHAAGVGWAVGGGSWELGRYGPTIWALQTFGLSLVAAEARNLTQPSWAIAEWRRYRGWACYGHFPPSVGSSGSSARSPRLEEPDPDDGGPEVSVHPLGFGLGLRISF